MIKIPLQIRPGHKVLAVISREDMELLKVFKPNQVVNAQITGHKRPRSVEQNAWAHVMFKIVSENTEDTEWDTPEKVKRNVKMAMGFYDKWFVVRNNVFFELRSFAFDKMDQAEADRRYNEAKEICAQKLNVDPKILEARAQEERF